MRFTAALFCFSLGFPALAQVVDTEHSKYAVLHPIPIQAVTLDAESFWGKRRQVTLQRSMPTMFDELEKAGTMDNFRRLEGQSKAPRRGPVYTDSDLYKWMEAAAFFLTG